MGGLWRVDDIRAAVAVAVERERGRHIVAKQRDLVGLRAVADGQHAACARPRITNRHVRPESEVRQIERIGGCEAGYFAGEGLRRIELQRAIGAGREGRPLSRGAEDSASCVPEIVTFAGPVEIVFTLTLKLAAAPDS